MNGGAGAARSSLATLAAALAFGCLAALIAHRALAILVVLAACGATPKRHFDVLSTAPAEYPGVLRSPASIPANFFVRQTLTVHTTGKDGKRLGRRRPFVDANGPGAFDGIKADVDGNRTAEESCFRIP